MGIGISSRLTGKHLRSKHPHQEEKSHENVDDSLHPVRMFITAALAQTADVKAQPLTNTDIQLLRSNLQADKNEVIAHTMRFTETESAAFWPLFRDYSRDQQVIGDARVQLGIDAKFTRLREDDWPKFEKALGAKRAAKGYQVDNRLSLMITLQLASEIPLIP